MEKHHSAEGSQKMEFDPLERVRENPLFIWCLQNSKILVLGFAGLLIALFFLFKWSSVQSEQREADYLLADSYFDHLAKMIENQAPVSELDGTLDKLIAITERHSELASRYDGIIAQLCLLMGEEKRAYSLAEKTLKRVAHDALPHYAAFTESTLEISMGELAEGLEKSQKLRSEIGDTTLSAYLLFRAAALQNALGNSAGELAAWKQWSAKLEAEESQKEQFIAKPYMAIAQELSMGGSSLSQYIGDRIEKLEKAVK